MFYVYCLESEAKENFHYYGFTSNIEKRLEAHKRGKVRTTKRFKSLKLLGYRKFRSRDVALQFEKDLKRKASYRNRFVRELKTRGGAVVAR